MVVSASGAAAVATVRPSVLAAGNVDAHEDIAVTCGEGKDREMRVSSLERE